MKKITIVLRYIICLTALCVIPAIRKFIGQNLFLPFKTKLQDPMVRGLARFWTIALLYFLIRLFFTIDVELDDVCPFKHSYNVIELLVHFLGFPVALKSWAFLYYLSYIMPVLALCHVCALEYFHLKKKAISSDDLGQSLLFGWLVGKKLGSARIDQYFIWGFVEPLCVGIFGITLWLVKCYPSAVLFLSSALAMAIQGQHSRSESRQGKQLPIDGRNAYKSIEGSYYKFDEDGPFNSNEENRASLN